MSETENLKLEESQILDEDEKDGKVEDPENLEELKNLKEPNKEEEPAEIIDPRTLLTKEQVDYFREMFDEIDVDKKERISTKYVGIVLRTMGFNPTKAEVKHHMKLIDPKNKGMLSCRFNHFVQVGFANRKVFSVSLTKLIH